MGDSLSYLDNLLPKLISWFLPTLFVETSTWSGLVSHLLLSSSLVKKSLNLSTLFLILLNQGLNFAGILKPGSHLCDKHKWNKHKHKHKKKGTFLCLCLCLFHLCDVYCRSVNQALMLQIGPSCNNSQSLTKNFRELKIVRMGHYKEGFVFD